MSENINIKVITPLEVIADNDVKMAVLPGSEGDLGVLFKHTPLLTLLRRGKIKFYNNEYKFEQTIVVDDGIAEIKNETIIVLSERAERLNSLDKNILENKMSKLQNKISGKNATDLEVREFEFLKFVLQQFN